MYSADRNVPVELDHVNSRSTLRLLIRLMIVCAILYVADYGSLRLRIPNRQMLDNVTIHTYYSVKLKNGKTEYDYAGDHVESCTNSAFPQLGYKPCWYSRRHTEQQINIDSGNPNNPRIF